MPPSQSKPHSYLISTSGHAQAQNDVHPHDVKNLLQLIEDGAEEMRGEAVIGFVRRQEGFEEKEGKDGVEWVCERYSYDDILSLSTQLASSLISLNIPIHHPLPSPSSSPPTSSFPTSPPPTTTIKPTTPGVNTPNPLISFLCPTGLEFLIGWVGLMRMGYGVVFIAPQCSPSAIVHLIKSTSSAHLVYHPLYSDLARSAQATDPLINLAELPSLPPSPSLSSSSTTKSIPDDLPSPTLVKAKQIRSNDVSHVFHTSGTSGVPKPIPQEHGMTVLGLPRRGIPSYLFNSASCSTKETRTISKSTKLQPPAESAAFTTTPLFHGGVSDLLRAWMARSVVYFYPTSEVPITERNVVDAVEACRVPPFPLPSLDPDSMDSTDNAARRSRFQPTSFLSVPYILSILTENPKGPGMDMLKRMELVSTGGAPLSTEVGDGMVEEGVRLVSRLGSSECGFLLSSHRDYATERDWEWLRNDSEYSDALVFEPKENDGTSGEEKFEMVVTDRWKSLTKSNREDGSYATGDLYIKHPTKPNVWKYVGKGDDVLVLSNGEKASPGPIEAILSTSPLLADVLVVGSDKDRFGVLLFPRVLPPPSDLLDSLSALIKQANDISPAYSQISRDMCLVIEDVDKIGSLPKSSKGTIQRGLAYEMFAKEIQELYGGATTSGVNQTRTMEEIESYLQDLAVKTAGDGRKPLKRTTDLFSWGIDSVKSAVIRTAMQNNLNTGSSTLSRNVVFENPSIARLAKLVHDMQAGSATVASSNKEEEQHQLMWDMVDRYSTFDAGSVGDVARTTSSGGKTILLTGVTGSLGAHLVHQFSRLPVDVVTRIVCLVRADDDEAAVTRLQDALSQRSLSLASGTRADAFAADLASERLGLSEEIHADLVAGVDVVIHAAWPVHFASSLVSFEENIKGTRNLLDLTAASSRSATFHFCSSLASVLGKSPADDQTLEHPSEDPATASPIGYSRSKWVTEGICRRAHESAALQGRAHILRVGQLCGDTGKYGGNGHWNEKEGWPLLLKTAQTTGCLPELDENPSWLPVDLAAKIIIDIAITNAPPTSLIYHVVHPMEIKWTTILDGLAAADVKFKRVNAADWLKKVDESEDGEDNPSKAMLGMWQAAYGGSPTLATSPQISCSNAQAASDTLRCIGSVEEDQIKRMVDAWRTSRFLS